MVERGRTQNAKQSLVSLEAAATKPECNVHKA